MAAERCPLCQNKLKNGECESCGYRLPDEGGISAYYNYDPSDYPQEQPAIREITPEHQLEEIYPNRPEPIDFKVRNDQGKTVPGGSPYQSSGQNGQQQAGQYGGQNGQQGQPYYRTNSPYGQYRQQGQYGGQNVQQGQSYYSTNSPYGQYPQQGQYGGQNGQQQYTYYRTKGQPGQYDQNGRYVGPYNSWPYLRNSGGNQQYNGNASQNTGGLGDFLAKYWWLLLIAFFFPWIGVIFYVTMFRNKNNVMKIEEKYQKLVLTVIILGFILPPWT